MGADKRNRGRPAARIRGTTTRSTASVSRRAQASAAALNVRPAASASSARSSLMSPSASRPEDEPGVRRRVHATRTGVPGAGAGPASLTSATSEISRRSIAWTLLLFLREAAGRCRSRLRRLPDHHQHRPTMAASLVSATPSTPLIDRYRFPCCAARANWRPGMRNATAISCPRHASPPPSTSGSLRSDPRRLKNDENESKQASSTRLASLAALSPRAGVNGAGEAAGGGFGRHAGAGVYFWNNFLR